MSLLLSVESIQKYFGGQHVLEAVSFEIRRGQRVALIGPNGAGKSTLFNIVLGRMDPDRGSVDLAKGARIGFLEQSPTFPADATVWSVAEYALEPLRKLAREIHAVSIRMAEAKSNEDLQRWATRFDQLQAELHQRDAFEVDYKIDRVLQGLGFSHESYDQLVSHLSGGQLNRLMLAALLLEEPDLMLLDEPSNHLDIEATEWLEEFLLNSHQAFLLISHDRYFLDRVVELTLELVNGTVDSYSGNYTKYQMQKADRLLVTQRTYEKQQAEIEKIQDFIRRNHYGQKAAQAEDRRQKLSRIELVEVPRIISAPKIRFPEPTRTGDIVLRVEDLGKSFARPLFKDLTFQIERGQRWGILGPNGCGKTTLLGCVVGQVQPDCGRISIGTGVRVGYFDQQLKQIPLDEICADAVRPAHRQLVDRERRDLLALFGITGDLALKQVHSLSGGERSRVGLARLAAEEANFLVLDEPTNHLDLWARASLEQALNKFDGTLLVVSHDRYFINQICTHLLVFHADRVQLFVGSYDSYRASPQSKTDAALSPQEKTTKSAFDERSARGLEPRPKSKRRFPYRKAADIEIEIANRERLSNKLHAELLTPTVLRNGRLVASIQTELEANQAALEILYEHWQEALELNG